MPKKKYPYDTVRLVDPESGGLDGYVFTDFEHARIWLQQGYIVSSIDKYQVQEITVTGPQKICEHCDGTGSIDQLKVGKTISAKGFLEETDGR